MYSCKNQIYVAVQSQTYRMMKHLGQNIRTWAEETLLSLKKQMQPFQDIIYSRLQKKTEKLN